MPMTQEMNQRIFEQLKNERELLTTSAYELINGIESIKPVFYYNRMICELFPNSDFAKMIGENYDDCSRKAISKRNDLIRNVINDNVHSNSIRLNPDVYFGDIEDTLTRNDHGIASGFTRSKVFLVALVFNLTYEQMTNLLIHCLGERKINFKNPYEVILSYCLIEHTNVCEHYLNLVEQYEKSIDDCKDNNEILGTLYYEEKFKDIDSDDSLLKFLITLPSDTMSTTSLCVFQEIFDDVYKYLSEKAKDDFVENLQEKLESKGLLWSIDAIYANESLSRKIESVGLISTNQVAKELTGENFRINRGTFRFLKKKVFSEYDLKEILSGNKCVTKENLVLILFYRYCLLGDRDNKIEELTNSDTMLEEIYDNFKETIGGDLEDAGFSDIYLPNAFERLILFCLVSENPIETFNMIMSTDD